MGFIPDLLVTVRYRERSHTFAFAAAPGATLPVGRADFQAWFGLPSNSLRSISKHHLSLVFAGDRFWLDEVSSFGTQARSLDDTAATWRKRHRVRLALGPRTELRLANAHPDDGSSDDVYILIENPGAGDTQAVFVDPLRAQLWRLLAGHRVAHLLGLPGSGKWFLARQLLAAESQERDQQLGVAVLPVSLDCRVPGGLTSADDEGPAWAAFARRLLAALGEAADTGGHAPAAQTIRALIAQFDARPPARPDETMAYFQRAFAGLVGDAMQSVLLVLTQFDAAYSDLPPEMLLVLARFLSEWYDISDRLYLVIATWRPLDHLRDDSADEAAADFVREFSRLFDDATLRVDYRHAFRALWTSSTDGQPLDSPTEAQLAALTGGNAGLLRDVLRRLAARGPAGDAAALERWLASEAWADPPLPTCDKLWRALRPDERDDLGALAAGRALDINRQQALAELGLLTPQGAIFSRIFAATIPRFRDEERRQERGLRIDAAARRVYVDNQPVALRDGRELDVLLALYERRGQVVGYRDLIERVYGQPGKRYDEAFFFADKEALQKAVARLCDRVDPQRAYITNRHGVGYCLTL